MPSTEPAGRSVVTAVGARKRNLRLGLTLCALYTLFYGAFVVTNAFYPDAMEDQPAGGLNLALLSGFGLIAMAIVLAFVYGVCCQSATEEASR